MPGHGADSNDGGLLIRIGVGPIAAGLGAFAIGFSSYMWLTRDSGPANAGLRGEAGGLLASGTLHPKLVDLGTTAVGSDIRDSGRAHLASFQTGVDFEFAFKEPSYPSASFDDRFVAIVGEALATSAPAQSEPAPPPAAAPRVTAAVPLPRPAGRSAVAQATPKRPAESQYRLASASDTSVALAYAPSAPAKGPAVTGPALKDLTPKEFARSPTAIPATQRFTTLRLVRCICRTGAGWKPIPASATTWTIRAT